MMKKWVTMLALTTAMVAGSAKLIPRPPIYGIPAKTLPKKRMIVRGYFIYPNFALRYNPSRDEMESLPEGMKLKAETFVLKLRYGITNRITAIANLPLISKSFTTESFSKSSTGLGDCVGALLFKIHHDKRQRFLSSFLLWAKFPTARTSNLSPQELPLGTGSYDYGFAFLPEKELGKWDLRWSVFYKVRGKDYRGEDLANEITLSWSTAYNLSYRTIPEVSLVYNRTLSSSGPAYYYLKAVAGVQFRLMRTFLLQAVFLKNITAKLPFADRYAIWLGFFKLI